MARPPRKPKAERKAIVRSILEHAAKGGTYTSGARQHGIPPSNFYNWARGLGIVIPPRHRNPRRYTHAYRQALAEQFVHLCRTGYSMNKASKLLGITRGSLLYWAAQFGFDIKPCSPGMKGYSADEKHGLVSAVIRLMDDGLRFSEACRASRTHDTLVHKWATAEQHKQIDQHIRKARRPPEAVQEQAYLVAQADELSELFGSSEPLGWEAD